MGCQAAIIVDDDPFWMNEIASVLRSDGVTVYEAIDGDNALRLLASADDACVILDIILPERDGLEIITAARAIKPDVKILAISGGGRLGPDFYLRLATAFGAIDTIQKPFTAQQLRAKWLSLAAG